MSDSINARIGYLSPMTEFPISHSGYPDHENLVFDWREVQVSDAGTIVGGPSLKEHGFTTVPHKTAIEDLSDTEKFGDQFRAEVREIVKNVTGASEVAVIPIVGYRIADRGGSFGPALFCHNDYTAGSTPRHIAQLDPELAQRRLSKRFAAYNIWRLVSTPPQDLPLAVCDARSVTAPDVIPGEARFGEPGNYTIWGEMAMFRYNPAHRWYYFPKMTNEEMLIWCGYDSDPGYASIVPHTAIVDPNCPPDVPPRRNVECRCYAFFDD